MAPFGKPLGQVALAEARRNWPFVVGFAVTFGLVLRLSASLPAEDRNKSPFINVNAHRGPLIPSGMALWPHSPSGILKHRTFSLGIWLPSWNVASRGCGVCTRAPPKQHVP
eukprot:SM000076S21766  [mRNA]  locus=s76:118924:119696:+ [translate_table: standard]